MTFGGLPYCALLPSREEKTDYLKRLFDEVFLRDIIERNRVHRDTFKSIFGEDFDPEVQAAQPI